MKKYRVLVSFYRKLAIFANTYEFWENLKKIKTHKNSYMRPLCITDLENEGHDQKMWSLGQFLPQTDDF
jgi:hypothetical protein